MAFIGSAPLAGLGSAFFWGPGSTGNIQEPGQKTASKIQQAPQGGKKAGFAGLFSY